MAETTLQLGFVPKERGNYTSGTNYYKDNVVQYNGSSYIADPVGWSESDPTATYVTIAPTDASGNLNAGWRVFASGNNTFTTGEKVDNMGIDTEPTAGSDNLVKSGGVTKTIRDKVYVNKDASSLIGEWVVDGTAITFESSDSMNGTFTSHTNPNKPASTRPYFRFQGFENGKKYRLRLHAVVNSIRTNEIEFLYCNRHAATWSEENKMRDADSGNSANVYSGKSLDCVFVADSSKTYIEFSMDSYGIDESVTISEFSIEELSGIDDVYADVNAAINVNTNNIATLQTDVIKARTNVNKFGFIGRGETYVLSEYYHLLQKGHTYRIHVMNDVWEDPEGTTSSQYKFLFALVKNNNYIRYITPIVYIGGTVIRDYTFTMPYEDSEYDFLRIGGRANEGVEISLLFEDITDVLELQIQHSDTWVKPFGKDDYYYKARLNTSGEESTIGTNYMYIFRVNDIIHISALIDDDYKMLIGLYSDFDGAKKDTTEKRYEYIGDMTPSASAYKTFFKYGDSTIKSAYMAIMVNKADDTPITDTDIANIENSLELSFYPINSIGQINNIQKDIVDINGSLITINNLELYASNSNGFTFGVKQRLKFFYQNIKAGKKVSIDISNALQEVPLLVYGCAIHSDLNGAKQNSYVSTLQNVVSPWTSNNAENAVITASGVFNLYFKKSDNSAFTYDEIIAVRNTLSVTIVPDTSEVEDEGFDGYDELPLGSFYNSSTTLVESNYTTCVPYLGIKYKFMLPSDIKARVSYGNYSLTTQTVYAVDGEIVSLSGTGMVQRVQFAKTDSSALDYSVIENYIANGRIKVYYKRLDLSVEERNCESETYVKAAMLRLKYADDADVIANGGLHSMPVIVHSSDFHGDVKRFENFVDYAHYLNADSIIATGDNVLFASSQGTLYMKDVITKKPGIPFLNCIGNHECLPKETYDNEYLFNNHIAPYITQGNYLSVANTPATMPYYYVDLAEKNLRIIIINQYDNACYYGAGLGGRLGQTQVTWLCNTLLSTPEGYGVIIGMHANETKVNTPTELAKWNQTVDWTGGDEDTSGYCVNGLYVNAVRPIRMIIDAFISKTQLNTTYDENTINGNNGETVTINVDFSNVANDVEFICYLTGHRHKDNIGYVDGATNLQLMLNVVCGNCHYPRGGGLSFSEGTDLPRGDRGVTQDAFNVYAIDRKNGNVKIARVGSSVNFEGIERKFLIAPYKSNS